MTGVSERGSETVIRYWIQERSSKMRAQPGQEGTTKPGLDVIPSYTNACVLCDQLIHALQKRASASVVILLSLSLFVAFWSRNSWATYLSGGPQGSGHMKPSLSTSFWLQPGGWLQWASGRGNDGREHAPARPWEESPKYDNGDGAEMSILPIWEGMCT